MKSVYSENGRKGAIKFWEKYRSDSKFRARIKKFRKLYNSPEWRRTLKDDFIKEKIKTVFAFAKTA